MQEINSEVKGLKPSQATAGTKGHLQLMQALPWAQGKVTVQLDCRTPYNGAVYVETSTSAR